MSATFGHPDFALPLTYLTGLESFQASAALPISTTGDTALITIAAGSTFVLYWLCVTASFHSDPATGGSWVGTVSVTKGLDGASAGADLCQSAAIYPQNAVVNLAPILMSTQIPIKGGAAGNVLNAHIAIFGTAPTTLTGEINAVGVAF